MEDFGFLDHDVKHRVIPNRAIHKWDVDRCWEALVNFCQLLLEVLLSIGLVDKSQTDIRQSHNEFGRREEPVEAVSSVPGLCVRGWGLLLFINLLFGYIGLQDDI